MSEALSPYLIGFSEPSEDFLTYHDIAPDKSLVTTNFTRSEFWKLSQKAAGLLQKLGAVRGERVLHVFSGEWSSFLARLFLRPRSEPWALSTGNRVEDLAFRLAGSMLGTVPVTVK